MKTKKKYLEYFEMVDTLTNNSKNMQIKKNI